MSGSLVFGGQTFSVAVCVIDRGWILDAAIDAEEELTAAGVDGTRWRTVGAQHPQHVLTTLVDAADFGAAIDLGTSYLTALRKGKLATVSLTVPIRTSQFLKAHIAGCLPTPLAGPMAGAVTAGAQASLRTQWLVKLTAINVPK